MSEQERREEGAMNAELAAKRATREGLIADLERFGRIVARDAGEASEREGEPPPENGEAKDGWRLRWPWLR